MNPYKKYCPRCGVPAGLDEEICKKCGKRLPKTVKERKTMYCQHCGKQVNDHDEYCYNCGKALKKPNMSENISGNEQGKEQQRDYHEEKTTKKQSYWYAWVIVGVIGLFLIICVAILGKVLNSRNIANEYGDQEIDWEDEELQQQNVDLSAYDDHGEWSDGIMWVHKTEGSYDYVEGSFAYIDSTGKVLGQWHSDEEWICPLDFNGDRALVYLGSDVDSTPMIGWGNYEKAYYVVIDAQGQERYSFVTFINPPYIEVNGSSNTQLHEFDEDGYLYYEVCIDTYGYIDGDDPSTWTTTHLLIPDENSFIKDIVFEKFTGHSYDGKRLAYVYDVDQFADEYENGYITYLDFFTQNGQSYQYCFCFDLDGNLVLDVGASMGDYYIWELPEVTDDGNLEVIFSGQDGNEYEVLMSMSGEWLTEPSKVS